MVVGGPPGSPRPLEPVYGFARRQGHRQPPKLPPWRNHGRGRRWPGRSLGGSTEKDLAVLNRLFPARRDALRKSGAAAVTGCATLSAPPVAWWPLDGNTKDIAGCDDGTILGSGGSFVPAMVGQGFSSHDQASYITAPYASQLDVTNFTVMAWARVDGISGLNKWIVSRGPSNGLNVDFNYALAVSGTACCSFSPNAVVDGPVSPGHLYLDFGDGTKEQFLIANDLFPLGSFVHVAATADGSTITLYVNGQVAGTAQQKVSPKVGTYSVMIDGGNVVPGIVDEVMVWNKALTAADIAAVYAADASGVCP